jgi:drug/metabolite transporter superfamily protein YnfA
MRRTHWFHVIISHTAEIGGGWLVWQTIREKKPWFYAVAGEPSSAQQHALHQCIECSHRTLFQSTAEDGSTP